MKRVSSWALFGLGLLVGCGDTSSQVPLRPQPSDCAPPTGGEDFGAQHDLYTLNCEPSQATPIGRTAVVDIDAGGAPSLSAQSLQAQAVMVDQGLFVYAQGQGSPIRPAAQTYVGDDFQRQEFQNLKPLVADILGQYNNPKTRLGQLRALRDWVARMAIHPHPPFHAAVTKNTHVLPAGWDWARFDKLNAGGTRWSDDSAYWNTFALNGYKMLNRLLNVDGTEAAPMLEKLGPGDYRIKKLAIDPANPNDPERYRTVLCTYQAEMLIALGGALGVHGGLISTTGHDTSVFFLPELGQWVYMDPSYNEDFLLAGSKRIASAAELYVSSAMGNMSTDFIAAKISGPNWEKTVYVDPADHARATYLGDGHPNGMTAMGMNLVQVQSYHVSLRTNLVQYDAPVFYNNPNDPATVGLSSRRRIADLGTMFPTLGVSIASSTAVDANSLQIKLASNWPNHDHYELQEGDGSWSVLSGDPVLRVGYGSIKVRSVDKSGQASTVAQFEVRRQ